MPIERPLFVTRYSLSDRSAIGVQTRNLMRPFPQARHVYWWASESRRVDSRSIPLEGYLFRRISYFKRLQERGERTAASSLSWWRDADLGGRAASSLRRAAEGADGLYLAPISRGDARRMRAIAEAVQLPFVVHLWDALDGALAGDRDVEWLIARASLVLSVSDSLIRDVGALGYGAQRLMFSREPSAVLASEQVQGPLRVVMVGDIFSYLEGVEELLQAAANLRREGVEVELVYVGPTAGLRRMPAEIRGGLNAVGFLNSPDDRDRVLAGCSIGYLPGPYHSPEQDARSRYSVPSRLADYLAVGLPVVGALHPGAAAVEELRNLGVDASYLTLRSTELEGALRRLRDAAVWRELHTASVEAFQKLYRCYNPTVFESMLRSL
jgi:glycosyltransferase involved in cell wall biosynthesis